MDAVCIPLIGTVFCFVRDYTVTLESSTCNIMVLYINIPSLCFSTESKINWRHEAWHFTLERNNCLWGYQLFKRKDNEWANPET